MKLLREKLFLSGFLLMVSSILLSPLITFAAMRYVSFNFAHQLNLNLLGFDFFWSMLSVATSITLLFTGLTVLLIGTLVGFFDFVRLRT